MMLFKEQSTIWILRPCVISKWSLRHYLYQHYTTVQGKRSIHKPNKHSVAHNQINVQELWTQNCSECRLLLGQMRWSWETVAWQTKHRWKQTFSAHFSNVLSESVPWIRKWPLSSVLHALPVTKEYFASVYMLPCFYVLLFIFITVINWGIVSCKVRQEFLMIMYVSKGGFQSWGNAF